MHPYVVGFIFFYSLFSFAGFDKDSFINKLNSVGPNLLSCAEHVNKDVHPNNQLSFASRKPTFDKPNIYSWILLEKRFNENWGLLDAKIKEAALEGSLKDCQLDLLNANWRYIEQIAYVIWDTQRLENKENSEKGLLRPRWMDLRSYLTLKKKIENNELDLTIPIQQIEEPTKKLLFDMCRNFNQTVSQCRSYWKWVQTRTGTLEDLYNVLKKGSEKLYQSFFKIYPQNTLFEVITTKTPESLKLTISVNGDSFGTGKDKFINAVKKFWNVPGLEIEFADYKSPFDPYVKFNKISSNFVMSKNPKLIGLDEDYLDDAETLAHEFGHVLGFSDCYIEFYDPDVDAYVYYALDDNDIMCGTSSKVFTRHVEELRRAYR